jgi:hypothetical protein
MLDTDSFSTFIVVSHNPWSPWFEPGHPFNSWVIRLLISSSNNIKLTMLLDKTKYFYRLNQWQTNSGLTQVW